MASALLPTCPLTGSAPEDADCAKRLMLRECLDRRDREAHLGTLDTGRYRCRYVVWGRGPAIVLIPGLASDALSFTMLLARLQTSMRCVSYDLPAGIDDAAIVNHYRHEDLADDLFRLLDHLKINTCILYGFSFGSTIALRAMTQQPGRISRAILQGGFAHRSLSRAEAFVASWGRFLPGRLHQVPFFERLMAYNQREPFLAREPEVWQFFLERQGHTPIRAFASRVLMIDRLDLRPLLPGIQTPTLLVSGDRDPSVESRCREELQQGLPKVAHAEIESCGHQAHLTHPEVLCEAIRHFLSQ